MIGIYFGSHENNKGWMAEDCYLCQEDYVKIIPEYGSFPDFELINKINANEEGYFDFSKGMIDIGSELGQFSLNTNFTHYEMFDGNDEKCVMAAANMLIRGKHKICNIHNTLLSDEIEDIKYDGFLTSYSNVTETYHYKKENEHLQRSTTLDSYNIKDISFIKIDVEGMEEKVLRGGIGTIIRNNYPAILFECWDVGYFNMTQERHDSLKNFLKSLGYEIIWYWGDFENHLAIHK